MVTRAEKAFERFSLSKYGMTALPIAVRESTDGRLTYTAYRGLLRRLRAFERSGTDPFSADGIKHLYELAEPLMRRHGYTAREGEEIILDYAAYAPLPKGECETVIIKNSTQLAEYEPDTTSWRLELDADDPADVICAVIKDGHLVAFAGVNDLASDDSCELNVECAAPYRRRGYAVACVRGLCNYLFETLHVECVTYKCRLGNRASVKTAESAGFAPVGRSFTLIYDR